MNAGLGNQNTFYRKYGVYVGSGRIVHCPLCLDGPNEEIHFLMACSYLHRSRWKILIYGQGMVDDVHTPTIEDQAQFKPPCLPDEAILGPRTWLNESYAFGKRESIRKTAGGIL